MRVLKYGMNGDDVLQWKTFLLSRYVGFDLNQTDLFDDDTLSLTLKYQSENNLTPDGIVGKKTLSIALSQGMHYDDLLFTPQTKMMSQSDKTSLFGTFSYKASPTKDNPEGITITDNWVYKNIDKFHIPQLQGIKGAPSSCFVYLNKQFGPTVQKFFEEIEKSSLLDQVKSWDGAYYARFVRGSKTYLSNHSYGTAFDINGSYNPLGTSPDKTKIGSTYELAKVADTFGIYWGGFFDRPDAMHFEMGML